MRPRRVRSRAAVAKTIGVSRTTVASRLSTAVTAAATAKTSASSRRGRPRAPRAMQPAHGVEQPRAPAVLGEHSSAARKPTVGAEVAARRARRRR